MSGEQININQITGSSLIVGNVLGNVYSSGNVCGSDQKQTLADAAREIQLLLSQLEKVNPTATEPEQVAYINIATKPDLKRRVVAALKQGGEAAIDEFITNSKYLKLVKAVAKGWLESGQSI